MSNASLGAERAVRQSVVQASHQLFAEARGLAQGVLEPGQGAEAFAVAVLVGEGQARLCDSTPIMACQATSRTARARHDVLATVAATAIRMTVSGRNRHIRIVTADALPAPSLAPKSRWDHVDRLRAADCGAPVSSTPKVASSRRLSSSMLSRSGAKVINSWPEPSGSMKRS
jgi:hypothetical protein